jgi:hypothetical protein
VNVKTSEQQSLLAMMVRNAATHQCIFSPWTGLEFAYRDGALYRMTLNTSQFERAPISAALLRVEELVSMADNDIWARVMGEL